MQLLYYYIYFYLLLFTIKITGTANHTISDSRSNVSSQLACNRMEQTIIFDKCKRFCKTLGKCGHHDNNIYEKKV